jgi:hypothetical protein
MERRGRWLQLSPHNNRPDHQESGHGHHEEESGRDLEETKGGPEAEVRSGGKESILSGDNEFLFSSELRGDAVGMIPGSLPLLRMGEGLAVTAEAEAEAVLSLIPKNHMRELLLLAGEGEVEDIEESAGPMAGEEEAEDTGGERP